MTVDLESLGVRLRVIERTVPLLEAIRSVAEIAYRRADRAAIPIAAYAARLEAFLADVAAALDGDGQPVFVTGAIQDGPSAVLVISSERGLCGGFNSMLAARTRELVADYATRGEALRIICWGTRARRLLESTGEDILYTDALTTAVLPAYETIEAMALQLLDLYERHRLSRLLVLHCAPAGRFQYTTIVHQVLPPQINSLPPGHSGMGLKPASDGPSMTAHVLAEWLLIELYSAVVQSALSEQLARISTMRLAVDNARKLAEGLRFEYELARQRKVTNSLLELVTGYRIATEG